LALRGWTARAYRDWMAKALTALYTVAPGPVSPYGVPADRPDSTQRATG
jgi:hypothetical protein